MGEAKRRDARNDKVLADHPRCIYCGHAATTCEHMPPKGMFLGRSRPAGLVFAACFQCNNATSGADATAAFFARLRRSKGIDRSIEEAKNLQRTIMRRAPGVLEELFGRSRKSNTFYRGSSGLLEPAIAFRADGPCVKLQLDVFSAKLAMALYREHIGKPLPLDGAALTMWFLNAGLMDDTAQTMLRILPFGRTLQQGSFKVTDQFGYRFNCDGNGIVAALVGFHSNFHVFCVAAASPSAYGLDVPWPHATLTRPGELQIKLSSVNHRG